MMSSPQRPPSCPAKRLGEPPAAALGDPGVAVAVAVLLQAQTGRVLLTRRARALRLFPHAWVPPGELGGGQGDNGDGGGALWGAPNPLCPSQVERGPGGGALWGVPNPLSPSQVERWSRVKR